MGRRHRHSNGQTRVQEALDKLPAWQRGILFLFGMSMIGGVVYKWVFLGHGHENWVGFAAELGGSVVVMTFGLLVGITPLGMWVLRRLPLPSFLQRHEPHHREEDHGGPHSDN